MSPRFRVLLADRAWPDWSIEREILHAVGAEIIEAPTADEPVLITLARDADAIGACWGRITPAVIEAAPRCRVVSRFGIGLDNIAVETASRLGIPVTNVPDYCVDEVSDHALALLLACARNIGFFHHRTKQGEYALQSAPPMRRLRGQILGLIGLGRIGQALARKAQCLGLEVLAHTPSGRDYGTGCRMAPLEELLAASDYVSLHLPLTPETRGLLRLPQFERMRPAAFLINTARGPLIDSADLMTALERGLIAGAALDVFDPEPPDLSLPLYRHERVLVTPHAGFVSTEALLELRTRAARQIATVLQGGRPENVVNPHVYRGV